MSKLYLKAEDFNGKTILKDSFFTSPIKVAKPFYKSNYTEIMMMTASAGILEGDFYDIQIDLDNNTNLKFLGQSYTKIFKSQKNGAYQRVKISLKDNSKLIYFPSPIIPFEDSIFRNDTEVYLTGKSQLIFCDILSCGRVAMNEKFKFKSYRSRVSIYVDGKLIFLDNQRLVPSEVNLDSIGYFEHFTHTGFMFLYGFNVEDIPNFKGIEIGITKALEGNCIRIFANSSDDIMKFANKIIENINV